MLSRFRRSEEQRPAEQIFQLAVAFRSRIAGDRRLRHISQHGLAGRLALKYPKRLYQCQTSRLVERLVDGPAERVIGILLCRARKSGGSLHLASRGWAHLYSTLS